MNTPNGIQVRCMGFPVLGFPKERIDPKYAWQTVWVDWIMYKRTEYATGAYVALRKTEGDIFVIEDVALQSHLLRYDPKAEVRP